MANPGDPLPPGVELNGTGALAGLPDLRVLEFSSMNATDNAYAAIATFKHLREVRISAKRLTDTSLTHLGKLPNLELFQVSGNISEAEIKTMTAAGIKGLAAAPRLREVRLWSFPLDDEGCKHLAGMKNLQTLQVSDRYEIIVTVSDEGLRHLAGAAKLTQLDLNIRRGWFTDKGVKHLAGMKQLTRLDLGYGEVTDEGVRHLAGLKKLRSLTLSATAISNAGLEHLKGLANLESLDLRGNGSLTSAGLKPLHQLKGLKRLELQGTKMYGTPAREKLLAELRKALSNCEIITQPQYGDP